MVLDWTKLGGSFADLSLIYGKELTGDWLVLDDFNQMSSASLEKSGRLSGLGSFSI